MTLATITPFDHDSDAQWAILGPMMATIHPDEHLNTAILRREHDDRDRNYMHHRFWLHVDDTPVGSFQVYQVPWDYEPQTVMLRADILPAHETVPRCLQVIAFALDSVATQDFTAITVRTQDYATAMVKTVEWLGFAEVLRELKSRLDLTAFDDAAWDSFDARFARTGIELLTVSQLRREQPDDWLRVLWELDMALDQDVPVAGAHEPLAFESYQRMMADDNPMIDHDRWILARDGARLIGLSAIYLTADPHIAETGLTGVHADYRRMGIATAMKLANVRRLVADGFTAVLTDNEIDNPMLDINRRLGFARIFARMSYKKALITPADGPAEQGVDA